MSQINIFYLDFDKDIFQQVVTEQPALYVVDDEQTANIKHIRSAYEQQKKPLQPGSDFMTLSQLKEVLFPADEIILREEKLSVVLYELLNEKEKARLEIDSYNDIIDFSARFQRFYKELNEYKITSLPDLKGWQKKRYELFSEIRKKYRTYLAERGYIDKNLLITEENFSPDFLKKYSRLVLFNIFHFTPREKDILNHLKEHIEVDLYLQLPEEDFREQDLKFTGLSLPSEPAAEIGLYTSKDEIGQLVSGLHMASGGPAAILSPRLAETGYQHLLSADMVEMSREEKFTHSPLYKFIENLFSLLKSAPPSKRVIGISETLCALDYRCFREYFKISSSSRRQLCELARQNFLYLDEDLIKKKVPDLQVILKEVKKLQSISSMSELIDYVDSLRLSRLASDYYENDAEQFYDALLELSALEDMKLVSSWSSYYSRTAVGLMERLLQYLEFKKIKPGSGEYKPQLRMEDLNSAPYLNRDRLVIINARQGWLFNPGEDSFLLTELQRQQLGLPASGELRAQKRYYFFRHLLASRKADVLALENVEENQSPGSFVEELKLKYNLDYQPAPVGRRYYPQFFKNIFDRAENQQSEEQAYPLLLGHRNQIENEKELPLEKNDFSPGSFNMSYYKYRNLTTCYFRFFCENLIKLPEVLGAIEQRMKPLTFGSIVHTMAEKIMNEVEPDELKMNRTRMVELFTETAAEFELKIDHRFKAYYNQVIKEELVSSMEDFFSGLKSIFAHLSFIPHSLEVEYTPQNEKSKPFYSSEVVDFYLGGRIDLLFAGQNSSLLVDFKSGGLNEDQLNLYALLVAQTSEKTEKIYKYMYQVMNRRFPSVPPGQEKTFAKTLSGELEDFLDEGAFTRSYKAYICKKCPYKHICRVVKDI